MKIDKKSFLLKKKEVITSVFVQKLRQNVMYMGKIAFRQKIEKGYVLGVKLKTYQKTRYFESFENACVVGYIFAIFRGGGAGQIITQRFLKCS